MKATEHYFPVVLYYEYKAFITLGCNFFKRKVIRQYFPVVVFIMLHEVVLTFESVDEILKCNLS